MPDFDRELSSVDDAAPLGPDTTRLRLLSILAPAAFVAVVLVSTVLISDRAPTALLIGIGVLISAAAAALFSSIVFDLVERGEARLIEHNRQLAAVRGAAITIAGEYELRPLLQRFVDVSRELTDARYGAMSVTRPDGSIQEFITSGLGDEERARIGAPPVGRGLLGVIIREGAIRLDDMSKDPRSVGFPANHPPMRSLLGVPVVSRGRSIGNLYLTDKQTAAGFTDADEQMVRTFAAHAALALETSRLQQEARELAVHRERERIGMDLHDGIVQSIYAVNLGLETALDDAARHPDAARAGLEEAIDRLSAVISDIRSYIFELRPAKMSYDLSESVQRMIQEFADNTTMQVVADVSPALPALSEDGQATLFHVAREALVNARKHSAASQVRVSLHPAPNRIELEVSDDGRGFKLDGGLPDSHRGLRNMEARALAAGATFSVESEPGRGTVVRVDLPLRAREGVAV